MSTATGDLGGGSTGRLNAPQQESARGKTPSRPGLARRALNNVSDVLRFSGQVIRGLPVTLRTYPSEVFRQTGLFIRANSLVIVFMIFMFGSVLGLTAHYMFNSIGIASYVGAVNTVGAMRGIMELVFGWIVAAKFGCGVVAEVGAMRINEEIDAMEVMGIRSREYLIGTRFLATLFAVPLLWLISLAVDFLAGYLFNAMLLHTASKGAFVYVLFLFQNTYDLVISISWAAVLGVVIVLVSSYYGYTASGGPVGVGRNTARSMLVNLVLISITAVMFVQLFYGNDPNAPIAK